MTPAMAEEARLYTPEDLLSLPDSKSDELVDGRLVERKMGAESSLIGMELSAGLHGFSREPHRGTVFPAENGYQCFAHAPVLVRKPDISFVKKERLPREVVPKGWIRITPDLVVEVVLPGDTVVELEEKLEDDQKAGVPLIWVIYPEQRKARVFRLEGPITLVTGHDELTGEDVLPGFRCPLREILPPVAAGEAAV